MAKNFFSSLLGRKPKADGEEPETVPLDAQTPVSDPPETNEPETGTDKTDRSDTETHETTGPETNTTNPGQSAPTQDLHEDHGPDLETQEPSAPELIETNADPEPTQDTKPKTWFGRLRSGLTKSSSRLSEGVASIFTKRKLDDETLEELEDLLITSDLGVGAAGRITSALATEKYDKEVSSEEVRGAMAAEVASVLAPLEKPLIVDETNSPHVILMIGVNGAGKTTTIGKLAKKFSDEGKSVLLAAGDTFRAAAIEQLAAWGERTGAPVVSGNIGADAAGLAYDAIERARAESYDIVIIDTAGRLQNKTALMDELAKIVRVIKKHDANAPHDVVLVLDATVGQNALSQAEAFSSIAGVTGLVMTKLDGTARGGVLVALADKFSLPIHFVGVGESVEDLQAFNAAAFSNALAGIAKSGAH